jgi:hypothetical protein
LVVAYFYAARSFCGTEEEEKPRCLLVLRGCSYFYLERD